MSFPAVDVVGAGKTFGEHVAVRDLSFAVPPGTIFGILGPNGAGKTTTIRMAMNIIGPDTGHISVLGEPSTSRQVRARIGYMPEERGLYPRSRVEEQIAYLAALKGVSRGAARAKAREWLDRFGLADWGRRKLHELSKGMQQKAQLAATLVHDPELVVVDEPMSGLDPVGMDLVRDVLVGLRREGRTVLLSSHQMHLVEQLCDRVVLINQGQKLIEGTVGEVRATRGEDRVVVQYRDGDVGAIPGTAIVTQGPGQLELRLEDCSARAALEQIVASGVEVRRFEVSRPSLHDVFVDLVGSQEVRQ